MGIVRFEDGNLKLKNNDLCYFDIETTGLSGIDDKLVCASLNIKGRVETGKEEDILYLAEKAKENGIIVTYKGETFRGGGFDFPFLRSYCIKHGLEWPFAGARHLDLYPLVKQRLNTDAYPEVPSKRSLNAGNVKEIAKANNLSYSTKKETYKKIIDLYDEKEEIDWVGYDEGLSPDTFNDLQSVYQQFFDPDITEEYIDGGDVPKLYKEGKYDEIYKHCEYDVTRLQALTEAILPTLPPYYIDRAMIGL